MTDKVELGSLITNHKGKDAVHVAIAPVKAIEDLKPGDHIGFVKDSTERVAKNGITKHIGIVDPFLRQDVKRGDMFWVMLYPNTITSLRHEWTHPDFIPGDAEEDFARAAREQGVTRDRLICIMQYGSRGNDNQVESVLPSYIWDLYERITGDTANEDRRSKYMGCAC